MFINAHLRPVLHGFESFVPQRTEFLRQRQRLLDMTNNGVSAWADFRDAASLASTPESCWDHHNDDFGDNENTPVSRLCILICKAVLTAKPTNAYLRYCQDTPRVSQAQNIGYSRTHEQVQGSRRASTLSVCDEQMVAGLSVFDGHKNSFVGHPSQSWGRNTNRQHSMAQATNSSISSRNQEYQPLSESCLTSVPSTLPVAHPQPSYPRASCSILDESFGTHHTSPTTDYYSYSSSAGASDNSLSPITYDFGNAQSGSANAQWWPPTVHGTDQHQIPYVFPVHDGLPRFQDQQHLLETWNNRNVSADWPTQASAPEYMSPDQFPMDRFHAASSSMSSHGTSHSFNDSMASDAQSDQLQRDALSIIESSPPRETHRHRHRHLLPDSSSSGSRNFPVLRSNDSTATRNRFNRSRSYETKSSKASGSKTSSHSYLEKNDSLASKTTLKRIEPKVKAHDERTGWAELPESVQALQHREAKDEFLVKSKLAGMSYKDIRRQGKFTEAESTLRGRFRTLTKDKNARVRKPTWNDSDVRLLKRAVRKLAQNSGTTKVRIPWKQVAEYIASHGGSYHFGNATCRKKWDELQGPSTE